MTIEVAATEREQQKQSGTQTSVQGSFDPLAAGTWTVVAEAEVTSKESQLVSATTSAVMTARRRQATARKPTAKPRRALSTLPRFIAGEDSMGGARRSRQGASR